VKKSVYLVSLLGASFLSADSLSDSFKGADVDGEVRVVNYTRTSTESDFFGEARGSAVGVQLGLSTKPIHNIKGNVRFFSTNAIGGGDKSELIHTNLVDLTKDYAIIGVANIEYNDGTNIFKVGREELHTPLVSSDDARVIKDLFSTIDFSTTIIPKTTLRALYIDKNSGMDNSLNGSQHKSDFVSMSKTLGTSYDRGMAALGIKNSSIANTTVSAWYYYGIDFIDMFYVDANYKTTLGGYDLKLEGHYWDIKSTDKFNKDVGDKIDYNYGGVRASVKKDNLVLQLAQERINLADNSHSIHTAWGMYSEYTYGFLMGSGIYGALNQWITDKVTKVDATKATAIYKFSKQNATVLVGYNWWDSDSKEQGDTELLDILVSWDCLFVDNASWQVIYENWNLKEEPPAGSKHTLVDNNLVRAKFVYKF